VANTAEAARQGPRGAFGRQARQRQPGLEVGAFQQGLPERDDLIGDPIEQVRPHLGGRTAQCIEARLGSPQRPVDFRRRGLVVRRFEQLPRCHHGGVERGGGLGADTPRDQMFSPKFHRDSMELLSEPIGSIVMRACWHTHVCRAGRLRGRPAGLEGRIHS